MLTSIFPVPPFSSFYDKRNVLETMTPPEGRHLPHITGHAAVLTENTPVNSFNLYTKDGGDCNNKNAKPALYLTFATKREMEGILKELRLSACV